jgi:hypothetical protein
MLYGDRCVPRLADGARRDQHARRAVHLHIVVLTYFFASMRRRRARERLPTHQGRKATPRFEYSTPRLARWSSLRKPTHRTNSMNSTAFDFSNVPPPPPPTAAPGLSAFTSSTTGTPYTLYWSVPPGTIDHYTLNKSVNGSPRTNQAFPASTTTVTLSASAPAGTDKLIDYMVRACSTLDDTSCSAWSNTVEVDISPPCTNKCQ